MENIEISNNPLNQVKTDKTTTAVATAITTATTHTYIHPTQKIKNKASSPPKPDLLQLSYKVSFINYPNFQEVKN